MLILKASLFGLLFFVQASYGSYLVCGPDASAGSRPLIVMLHGCDQTAAEFQRSTEICELAKKEQFHVLFPEQSRARNPIGCWNWYDAKKIEEEAQAVTATLQRVFEHKPIDKAKVHVAGISAGGAFAGYLASCHSDVF
ncbi:MAG: hypothetical protein KDD51_16290, partial [Bdellovibrionales bacterium]|nr:hypothetical protein [Bdellovibrionales bacterium]